MAQNELVKYANKEHIFVQANADMHTKTGKLRSLWLRKFLECDEKFSLPISGATVDTVVSVKTADESVFCMILVTKDTAGRKAYVNRIANYKNLQTATMKGENFTLENREILKPKDINTYNQIPSLNTLPL